MKKIQKILYSLLFFFLMPHALFAQILSGDAKSQSTVNTADFLGAAGVGGNTRTVGYIAQTVIEAFLSVLGVVFIILVIMAGYNWMTAAGDESKVTKAKDTLLRSVIGLLIIIGAYAITYFVFSNLPGTGGASTNPGPG